MRDSKIRIMKNEMASELNVLARDAARVARQNARTADFTRNILQRAIARDDRVFPGVSHLSGRGRRAVAAPTATHPARRSTAARAQLSATSIPACSIFSSSC